MEEIRDFAIEEGVGSDAPNVTIALLSYNQEKFVERAVESVLGQTFPSLQILISDDCSTDGTFDILRRKVDAYSGPHRVKLNRNPKNLGLVAHLNHVMTLADAEIIVAAAGDDVSDPKRASKIFHNFQTSGADTCVVCSAVKIIDDDDRPIGRMAGVIQMTAERALTSSERWMIGCSQAWRKSIFQVFGPIPANAKAEDKIIAFRAMLLGRIGFIDEDLVLYRQHAASITASHDDVTRNLQSISTLQSHLQDVAKFKNVRHERLEELTRIEKKIQLLVQEAELYLIMARASIAGAVWIWLANPWRLSLVKCLKILMHKTSTKGRG